MRSAATKGEPAIKAGTTLVLQHSRLLFCVLPIRKVGFGLRALGYVSSFLNQEQGANKAALYSFLSSCVIRMLFVLSIHTMAVDP
jgi:hypothetical protein